MDHFCQAGSSSSAPSGVEKHLEGEPTPKTSEREPLRPSGTGEGSGIASGPGGKKSEEADLPASPLERAFLSSGIKAAKGFGSGSDGDAGKPFPRARDTPRTRWLSRLAFHQELEGHAQAMRVSGGAASPYERVEPLA